MIETKDHEATDDPPFEPEWSTHLHSIQDKTKKGREKSEELAQKRFQREGVTKKEKREVINGSDSLLPKMLSNVKTLAILDEAAIVSRQRERESALEREKEGGKEWDICREGDSTDTNYPKTIFSLSHLGVLMSCKKKEIWRQ